MKTLARLLVGAVVMGRAMAGALAGLLAGTLVSPSLVYALSCAPPGHHVYYDKTAPLPPQFVVGVRVGGLGQSLRRGGGLFVEVTEDAAPQVKTRLIKLEVLVKAEDSRFLVKAPAALPVGASIRFVLKERKRSKPKPILQHEVSWTIRHVPQPEPFVWNARPRVGERTKSLWSEHVPIKFNLPDNAPVNWVRADVKRKGRKRVRSYLFRANDGFFGTIRCNTNGPLLTKGNWSFDLTAFDVFRRKTSAPSVAGVVIGPAKER